MFEKLNAETIEEKRLRYNRIRKSEYDPLILHNPKIELQTYLDLDEKINGKIMHFIIGQKYSTVISEKLQIYHWENKLERNLEIQRMSGLNKNSIFYTNKENESILLKSIKMMNPFKENSGKSLSDIKRVFSNQKGDCVLVVSFKSLYLVLPEFKIFKVLDLLSFLNKSKKCWWEFLLNLQEGDLCMSWSSIFSISSAKL